MKKLMLSALIAAACSLCVGVQIVGAQQGAKKIRVVRRPQPAKMAVTGSDTGSNVAYIRYDTLADKRVRITFSPPALKENEDFALVKNEDVDALVQKLACLTPIQAESLFKSVPKTVGDWFAALQKSNVCSADVSPVSQRMFVMTRIPWYESPDLYKRSTLQGSERNWRYQREGFSLGATPKQKLDILAGQMRDTVVVKYPTQVDSTGKPVEWSKPETMSVPKFFYQYGMLDSTDTHQLVTMLENEECPLVKIPPGMPYAKNTGLGIVGRNRVFDPSVQGSTMSPVHGDFLVARCILPSGRAIDVLEYCTNIAHPLMGAEFMYYVTPPKPVIALTPPTQPTAPPPPVKELVPHGPCRTVGGAVKCAAVACVVVTAVAWAFEGPNICGIPLPSGAKEGNKPEGAPINQFDRIGRQPGFGISFSFRP